MAMEIFAKYGDSFVGLVIDFVYKLFTKIIAFEPYMVLFFNNG